MSTYKDLNEKIAAMEKKYDKNFQVVFAAIKELMEPTKKQQKGKIGFVVPESNDP